MLVSISPPFYLNLRACCSTNEDILYCLKKKKKTQQNSNSVQFRGMPLVGAASEIRKAGDTALLGLPGLVRESRSGRLLLALGLIKPSHLFVNSFFFLGGGEKKLLLMEAFKIQELWVSPLCQAKVDSFK